MPFKSLEDKRIYRQKRRDAALGFIQQWLVEHPCVDCGEDDTEVLQFDHRAKATRSISTAAHNGNSLEWLEQEIDKCEIRCANCHVRRHRRAGWQTPLGYVPEEPAVPSPAPEKEPVEACTKVL